MGEVIQLQKSQKTISTRISTNREDDWIRVFVPSRFSNANLKDLIINEHNADMVAKARQYAKYFDEYTTTGLLLSGTVGTGKTHLSFGIGRYLASKGFWPYRKSFVDICLAIKRSWRQEVSEENRVKEPLLKDSPIILDDLGAEAREKTEQGWVSELLFEIVQTRYEKELPTIITTNLKLDELSQRYGERTASRICEMCTVTWTEGYDFRIGGI